MALTGHKRMHGQSAGRSKKIMCSCLITRKVIPYQNLVQYQERLLECKLCKKAVSPRLDRRTFCSQSCAASFNNSVYVKRKKKEKPAKVLKEKRIYSEKEKKAKRVSAVQAYRARKYNATMPDTDRKLINLIYEMCPEGYDVDHIVALANGGPHHQDNLQYLPLRENRRKGTRDVYDTSKVLKWQDIVSINK